MSRTTEVTCDYCTATLETHDDEEFLGWISVDLYDTITDEHKELDFCSNECVISHFS